MGVMEYGGVGGEERTSGDPECPRFFHSPAPGPPYAHTPPTPPLPDSTQSSCSSDSSPLSPGTCHLAPSSPLLPSSPEERYEPVGAAVIGTAASHQLLLLLTGAGVMEEQELLPLLEQHPDEFLGDVLVREGLLLDEYLQGALARLLHLPCVAVDGCAEPAARRIATLLPESFCREHRVMAVSRTRHFLTLAVVNPLDAAVIEEARAITGLEARLVLCSERQMTKLTDAIYCAPEPPWEGDAPAEPHREGDAPAEPHREGDPPATPPAHDGSAGLARAEPMAVPPSQEAPP
jgi:hypothetical protein